MPCVSCNFTPQAFSAVWVSVSRSMASGLAGGHQAKKPGLGCISETVKCTNLILAEGH